MSRIAARIQCFEFNVRSYGVKWRWRAGQALGCLQQLVVQYWGVAQRRNGLLLNALKRTATDKQPEYRPDGCHEHRDARGDAGPNRVHVGENCRRERGVITLLLSRRDLDRK